MEKHFGNVLKDAFKLSARMLHNNADAHDVIQDAAAIAISHESAPNMQSEAFKPWFYRVVRNKSIDKIRAQQRDAKRSDILDDSTQEVELSAINNPERRLENSQTKAKIDQALNNLSMAHREIILLKDFHDFSYAEIANILNVADGSVMSRLHRARMALKAQIISLQEEDNPNVK